MRYAMVVEYDGTAYSGWQRQKNADTIQQTVEEAIERLTGKSVYVPRSYEEKQLQRALLQAYRPENAPMVKKALYKLGREDLIPVLLPYRKKTEPGAKNKFQKNAKKQKTVDKRRRK